MSTPKKTNRISSIGHSRYTSKIIKATALLDDTKTLLEFWDEGASVRENFSRIREQNIFGKSSRSRIDDELEIFHQRYFFDLDIASALAYLVKKNVANEILHPILFYFSAKADKLLYDTTKILETYAMRGQMSVTTDEMKQEIYRFVNEGKTTTRWSENTISIVTRHLMATLRDFGILEGGTNKKIASFYLPNQAFAFIALYLYNEGNPGEKLVNHPDWGLFFLNPRSVERFFLECHQEGLLNYHGAGSVIRIDFPTKSLREYADVLTRK
ncbi:MAG: DUF1819 family protein [Methanomicrobiales archaeon]|nr:DUF1819 family protein [Methanomicrobiales archaeon]MDI6877464.1 DUF1819 family protein [Methanomicrobiales archaeon]